MLFPLNLVPGFLSTNRFLVKACIYSLLLLFFPRCRRTICCRRRWWVPLLLWRWQNCSTRRRRNPELTPRTSTICQKGKGDYIWPASCKKCRPRPAAASPTPRLSGSALVDNHNINGIYLSCYVNNFILYRCFQHRIGADLGLHYMKCPKVPFRVTLAI